MNPSLPIAKIDGKTVQGQAHIQPGVNSWIGVCITSKDLLENNPENWESKIIKYEGPFNCRKFRTKGKGKAKILAISSTAQINKVSITFEGIGEPELEKRLKRELKHSYDENLPVYVNHKHHSRKRR